MASFEIDASLQEELAEDPNLAGAVVVPWIAGSDKTTVSVATGQNDYYPLYGGPANLHNNVRRAHCNGMVLVAFLAIPKCELFVNISEYFSYHL